MEQLSFFMNVVETNAICPFESTALELIKLHYCITTTTCRMAIFRESRSIPQSPVTPTPRARLGDTTSSEGKLVDGLKK